MPSRPLAIFSPLPPTRSGIADYCLEQIPLLAQQWDICVVTADDAPQPDPLPDGAEIYRLSDWKRDRTRDLSTPRLYHLGNNPHHEFVYRELHNRAGVTVLHDYCLHHLIAALTLGQNNFEEYKLLMEHDHGEDGARMAEHRQHYVFSEYQQFLLPLNGTVLEASTGVIVHSEYARRSIFQRYPEMDVQHIPHHYAPPGDGVLCGSVDSAREALGLPRDKLVIVSLGHITPPKQIELALRALGSIKSRIPPFQYWLVGEPADISSLRRAISENGLEEQVQITGYVDNPVFYRYIEACDLIINLRYPSAGESSGTLVRSMGMGKCALVFDFQSFSDYPADTVVKLPLDTIDETTLTQGLETILNDNEYREGIAGKARFYIAQHHAQDVCARSYSDFLSECFDSYAHIGTNGKPERPVRISQIQECPATLGEDDAARIIGQYIDWIEDEESREYACTHQRRWAKTITYIPKPTPGMSALELGSYQVILPVLRNEFGFHYVAGTGYDPRTGKRKSTLQLPAHGGNEDYDHFLFNLEKEPFPFRERFFDLVLCCEVVEHMSMDPMFMVSEINRVLKDDGMLILTTPNITCARSIDAMLKGYAPYLYSVYNRSGSTDRHNIEYSPHEIAALLEAGGFETKRLETAACWDDTPDEILGFLRRSGYPVDHRNDNIIAIGFKKTTYINRYPDQIYTTGRRIRRSSSLGPFVHE